MSNSMENPFNGSRVVSCGRTDRQGDRQTYIARLVVTFHSVANASKNKSPEFRNPSRNTLPLFNAFHVRALYHTKTLITNTCTKRVLSSIVTLLHVSTVLGHLQGELSVTVTLGLHFIVEWECAVDCVLCTGGVNPPRSGPSSGPDRREFTPPKTTQYTVKSTFSLNCKVRP
jgi:hypothetical protein